MHGRLLQLGGLVIAVVLLCLGGWLLLRSEGAPGGAVPAPITVPARESATSTPPGSSAPTPGPTTAPQPPAPDGPTDVVAPPPAVDDDDDDDDDAGDDAGEEDGDD